MVPSPLHVDSHEITTGEIKRSKHFSSQIRSDDGILALGSLGGHSKVQWVHISLGNGNLWIPERVASTDGKVSSIARCVVVKPTDILWCITSVVECVGYQLLDSSSCWFSGNWIGLAKSTGEVLPAGVCSVVNSSQEGVGVVSLGIVWVKGHGGSKEAVGLTTTAPAKSKVT